MATFVFFHAHPDDEAIGTGGAIMRAKGDGHRVVLVTATRGELGNPVEGVAEQGDQLGALRTGELEVAASILGVDRLEVFGYLDSGMAGDETNNNPVCFAQTDVDTVAERLAAILREENAQALFVYDDNGSYGHPDHIQVYRTGLKAAELAGIDTVYQITMNRDAMLRSMEEQIEKAKAADDLSTIDGVTEEGLERAESIRDNASFGKPEAEITHQIDVREFIETKRKAMTAHASQIPDDSWFFNMPAEAFEQAFGYEHYILTGHPRAADAPFVDTLW